jgi:hypothetical protein
MSPSWELIQTAATVVVTEQKLKNRFHRVENTSDELLNPKDPG